MLLLQGNLGDRHRALNAKVNEAVENNLDFEEIKEGIEKSDVDRLFKIDVASKYKNLDFIVETLKSGDDLYVSKALKSIWLYEEKIADIMNPSYLHEDVFPSMSLKMKKKLLTMIAVHLKDDNNRAIEFYESTLKEFPNIAFKFLIKCPEDFKTDIIKKDVEVIRLKGEGYLKNFIGNSFALAELYLRKVSEDIRCQELPKLKHLYSKSSVKYLDLFEKFASYRNYDCIRFGLRMSKDIMIHYKERVLRNPFLYLDFINMRMLVKYSTTEDAEDYLISLFPENSHSFYEENFFHHYQDILSILPEDERFPLMKRLFTESYGEAFETSHDFFYYENHNLLTKSEKEAWALGVLSRGRNIGAYENHYFHRYLSFERAFSVIKNKLANVKGSDRTILLGCLVNCATTQRELETLFNFYQGIIAHEVVSVSECIMLTISHNHCVFDFDEDCWTAFKNFFKTVTKCNVNSGYWPCYCQRNYEVIIFMHHILNDNSDKIPEDTPIFKFSFYFSSISSYCYKIGEERKDKVYKYLIQHYLTKIYALDIEQYSNHVMVEIRCNIAVILELMRLFEKKKDDLPEIVMKHMKLDFDRFKSEHILKEAPVSTQKAEKQLMRYLKVDAKCLITKLSQVKENVHNKRYKIDRLLRKLKTYFAEDIAKEYLAVYNEMLLEPTLKLKTAEASVSGILMLANDDYCSNFLLNHVPTESKIKHKCIDRNSFHIQVAIGRNACYARSSQLQSNALLYIKGDYVKYCTPMLPSYLANLRTSECIQLMKSVLDARLPKYKYTLRLALQCFTDCMASKLLLDMWENAKDASMRTFLYITVCNKIRAGDASSQIKFLEVLKTFTLDLNIADEKDIFDIMISDTLPECVMNEYLQVVWKQVNDLAVDILYHGSVIKCIDKHVTKMDKEFVMSIANDHVKNMFDEGGMISTNDSQNKLIEAKWDLTANYIVSVTSDSELEKITPLVKTIFQKCLAMWNDINDGKQTYKDFSSNFIGKLESKCFTHGVQCFKYVDDVFKTISKYLQEVLPLSEICKISYEFKLSTQCRDVLTKTKLKLAAKLSGEEMEEILKEAPSEFARVLGGFVQEFEEKGITHRKITDLILENMGRIYNYNIEHYKIFKFTLFDVCVIAATVLIKLDLKYTYKLAVLVLKDAQLSQCFAGRCEQEYCNAVRELTELEDSDIKQLISEVSLR